MCVAVVQPAGKQVSANNLMQCYRANAHGAGYAFVDAKGEIVVNKGFFKPDAFIHQYEQDRAKNPLSPFLLHCRIATAGEVNAENCHPFPVKGGVMIHNGTLWEGGRREDILSDSREFAERMFNNLHRANVRKHIKSFGDAITKRNKLAFLYRDGSYVIINEQQGDWIEGCWYSNTHWTHQNRCG